MANQIKGAPLATAAESTYPKTIKVTFLADDGTMLATLMAGQKTFASGKIGYGVYDKVRLPNGERLQVSLNLPVIKSDGKSF